MAKSDFDLIVVGGGPAGLATAKVAAEGGLKVILFERGEHCGSKNVMGGVLYRQATNDIFPDFWKEAPVERPIIEQSYWFMAEKSAFKMGYRSEEYGQEPYNAFTVLRAKFDHWMAKQVEKAGVLIINETVVDELITDKGKVIGVRTGRQDGEVYAPLTVIAEGVNSLLTQQAGLRPDIPAEHLAVAVKEIITMPKEVIENRFNLENGMGIAIELVGEATHGMLGTGFIYTNKDSVSIGVGALLSQIVERYVNPNDLLEKLKAHPVIRPLIAGGETKEYLAHLIPEGGYTAMPKLYSSGLLVVGDAAMLVNGIHREGSNLALTSGKLAAQTALDAFKTGDFSEAMLSQYVKRLENSFVLQDLKKYRNATSLFEDNPHFFAVYPEMINDVFHEFFTIDSVPKTEKQRIIKQKIFKRRGMGQIAMDMLRGWRALG